MYAVCRSLPLTAVLAAAVSAHVVLENPKPFPFIDYGPTNPIAADGSDFPCKVPPGTALDLSAPATVMAIGEDQTLSFQGRAVHGGGSCQLALTKDQRPNKSSSWMVIHSIEGGCPARNQKGNLEGPNTDKYTFRIPAGIEPGSYVFSWTWNARIGGQPEYYMNCAPVEVTASKAAKKRQGPADRRAAAAAAADFPPLFMANMGDAAGGCTTGEALGQQIAIAYPDPGNSVERPEGDDLFAQPCDGNPRARPNPAAPRPTDKPADGDEAPPPASSSPSTPAAAPTTTTTSATTSVPTAVSSASATTMMTTTTTAAAPPASSTTPAAAPPAETTTTPPTPAPPAPSGGGVEVGDSAASCRHGQLACFDGGKTAWSCTGSTWVKIADAPAGMQCTVGVGNGENLVWKPAL